MRGIMLKVLLNLSGGVGEITEPPPIDPPPDPPPAGYNSPVSGDITFSDANFWYSAPGLAKTGFVMRSPGGAVIFRTSLTAFSVKVGGNWSTATTGNPSQSQIYLYVDGVYNQAITLTADNTTQTIAITALPAGVKIIKLVNGYAAQAAPSTEINRPNAGVYVQGVVTAGDIEIQIPVAPAKSIVLLGMSITDGASATRPTDSSWAMKLRNIDGYAITLDTYGARTLSDNDMHFFDAHATSMVNYLWAQMNGTSSKELWIDLATNDYYYGKAKSSYKGHLDLLVTKMQTLHPSVRIILIKPTNRTDYNTVNVNGATLGDMDAAMDEVAVLRGIEVMGNKLDVDLANMPDGLHPNQTGHDQRYAAIKADYLAL